MPRQRALIFVLLTNLLVLAGCSPAPLRQAEIKEPELRAIHAAFQEAVDTADGDQELSWHSGWLGNILVNLFGGDNLGLCYHWQEWTYQTMYPAVRETGWDLCGIAINVDWSGEHHAVLVWDPRRAARVDLLRAEGIAAGEDWLALPLITRAPAEIEDLSELETVPANGPANVEDDAGRGQNPDSGS